MQEPKTMTQPQPPSGTFSSEIGSGMVLVSGVQLFKQRKFNLKTQNLIQETLDDMFLKQKI